MDFSADIPLMLPDFGVDAQTPNGVLRGVFDNGYGQALNNLVDGSVPTFHCASADLPPLRLALNDIINITAASYRVVGIEPDGTGLSVLRLESV